MEETINITGIDRADLIAALYNGTKALGLGVLYDQPGGMTSDDVKGLIGDMLDGDLDFDYFKGRPLKVRIVGDEILGVWLYDRDAGEGQCAKIVAELKADVSEDVHESLL